jgi:hypothetical protein
MRESIRDCNGAVTTMEPENSLSIDFFNCPDTCIIVGVVLLAAPEGARRN